MREILITILTGIGANFVVVLFSKGVENWTTFKQNIHMYELSFYILVALIFYKIAYFVKTRLKKSFKITDYFSDKEIRQISGINLIFNKESFIFKSRHNAITPSKDLEMNNQSLQINTTNKDCSQNTILNITFLPKKIKYISIGFETRVESDIYILDADLKEHKLVYMFKNPYNSTFKYASSFFRVDDFINDEGFFVSKFIIFRVIPKNNTPNDYCLIDVEQFKF